MSMFVSSTLGLTASLLMSGTLLAQAPDNLAARPARSIADFESALLTGPADAQALAPSRLGLGDTQRGNAEVEGEADPAGVERAGQAIQSAGSLPAVGESLSAVDRETARGVRSSSVESASPRPEGLDIERNRPLDSNPTP